MKPIALICLCLAIPMSIVGCGGAGEPVTEEAATESEAVEGQLEGAEMTEEDYEKAMQQEEQQAGQDGQ